jgi:chromosome segregation ATPase
MRVRELEDRLVNQHQEHERWKTETTSSLESLKSEIAALRESLQASRTALTMAEAKLEAEMEPHQAHDSESSEDVGEALEIEAEPPTPPEAPLANEEGRERRHLHRLFGKR